MNLEQKFKRNKGITLIALVVTIIVLLILVGISISMLTGQNGLLNRASEAKDKTGISQEEESVKLSISDALTQGLDSITTEDLQTALTNNGLKGPLTGDGPWVYTGEYKKYDIEKSGSMTSKDNNSSSSDRIVKVMGNYGVSEDNRLWELDIDMDNIPMKTWTEINKKSEVSEIGEIQKAICSSGSYFVLTKSGEIYAWGDNYYCELGIGNTEDQSAPVKVNGITNVEELYTDGSSTFAKNKSGEIYSWGDNYYGQLGIGNTENQSSPVKVNGITNVEIYIGGSATFAKNKSGEVYAWGANGIGELGIGNIENQSIPVKVNGVTNVEELYIDGSSIFAKNKSGEIYAWGGNHYGQLGIGNTEDQSTPVKVNGVTNVEELYIDGINIFAKNKSGEIYAWGNNHYGQLGIGNTEDQSTPVKINGISNIERIYIDIGCYSIFAKTNTGEVYAWGENSNGQLGIGTRKNQNTPAKINGLSNVEDVSLTGVAFCLRTKDGKVYRISGENNLPEIAIFNDEEMEKTDKDWLDGHYMSIIYTIQNHVYVYCWDELQ